MRARIPQRRALWGWDTTLHTEYKCSIHCTKYMGFLHEDGGCLIQRSVLQRRCRLLLRILWQAVVTPSPIGETEYCDDRVCLSVCVFVCPRAYLRNAMSGLHQIFCARYLCPWLGLSLAALQYTDVQVIVCYLLFVMCQLNCTL